MSDIDISNALQYVSLNLYYILYHEFMITLMVEWCLISQNILKLLILIHTPLNARIDSEVMDKEKEGALV